MNLLGAFTEKQTGREKKKHTKNKVKIQKMENAVVQLIAENVQVLFGTVF